MQTTTLNDNQIAVIMSEKLLAAYERENRNPEWLVKFCRKFPGACFLSWVQSEFGKLLANKLSTFSDLDLSIFENQQGRGTGDSGLMQLTIDYHIYMDVQRLVEKGYLLKAKEYDKSVFSKLQGMKNLTWKKFFLEKSTKVKKKKKYPISATQIYKRYYRFKRFWHGSSKKSKDDYPFQRIDFIENGTFICGPARIDMDGKTGFGFWEHNPGTGLLKAHYMFIMP